MNPHCFKRMVGSIVAFVTILLLLNVSMRAGEPDQVMANYRDVIQPILEDHCYECHGLGANEGDFELDASPDKLLLNQELWLAVLNNLRAGIMPPAGNEKPSAADNKRITDWIKTDVFGVDPQDPDPGQVTVRRLNRWEYQNTIRDLMGFESSGIIFPPDDTGFGFDNIGDVLSLSPLLLEKYLQSAKTIVAETVPIVRQVIPRHEFTGKDFKTDDGNGSGSQMAYDRPATVSNIVQIKHPGEYILHIEVRLNGSFNFDPGRCQVTFAADGQKLYKDQYGWKNHKSLHYRFYRQWQPGDHQLVFSLQPLKDINVEEKGLPSGDGGTFMNFHILSVAVEGPVDPSYLEYSKNYRQFFPRDEPPAGANELREYAREVLFPFVCRAFRRIPDGRILDRLVDLAERKYQRPDKTFEAGIAQAMTAVLASPRFLFRIESPDPSTRDDRYPLIDEFSLASRLSYFLWSTMPDDELLTLAQGRKLRANLDSQVARMLRDQKSSGLERDFVGQWLRTRDVERVPVSAAAALGFQQEVEEVNNVFVRRFNLKDDGNPVTDEELEAARRKRRALRPITEKFNAAMRIAMRRETEMFFGHIMRNNRSLLELIDSRYTFVNERLAELYGIEGVKGPQMRLVELLAGSPRGGVLTHGTMLSVTSNPSRRSPVKRGLFILENILGTLPPPPPANVPELEVTAKRSDDQAPTLRKILSIHRESEHCSSCHSRMDSLGLAFENFNAIGMWRDTEQGKSIDASGTMITGESFRDVRDLKRLLIENHGSDVYRCVVKKMMIYALGRGLETYDEFVVDQIVNDLEQNGGHFNILLMGIMRSAAFQKQRRNPGGPIVAQVDTSSKISIGDKP